MNAFSDFEFPESDDLDEMLTTKVDPARATQVSAAEVAIPMHIEVCPKCRGTGRFRHLGPCFTCKGKGKRSFKQPAAVRQRNSANAKLRKLTKIAEGIAAFETDHPKIHAWIQGNTFEFAVAMRDALCKYGFLTEKQIAACYRCIEKRDAAIAARKVADAAQAVRLESAPAVNADRLHEAFDTAAGNGLKWPKLHFGSIAISPAGKTSKNPGALYVKDGDQYLGKIVQGKFLCVRECSDAAQEQVVAVINDPAAAARQSGLQTGRCSCCNRELTDPVSVANGIGPICAENYGW